ncbi:MAG: hydrogenase expression/formation protein HypE [Promethearchaeota archaeon]
MVNPDKETGQVVRLAHGAGGKLQADLIRLITASARLRKYGDGVGIDAFDDGGTLPLAGVDQDSEIVLTADGHTVHPLVFPGGDLGKLAVAGTVNDLLMMGATPVAVTSTVLVEEGLPFETLLGVADSFNGTLNEAGVALVAGDTKVMPRGSLQEMVISTTGVGFKPKTYEIYDSNVRPGDAIIVTGSIGDHGVALMAFREGLQFQTNLQSDVAVLRPLVEPVLKKFGERIHAMKDPTRGGLAAALNEWAKKSGVSIWLEEDYIPVKDEVRSACDMLGLDPLEVASEGRAIIAVPERIADAVLDLLGEHELGAGAQKIGLTRADHPGTVFMKTLVGGTRFVDEPLGALIPRIC